MNIEHIIKQSQVKIYFKRGILQLHTLQEKNFTMNIYLKIDFRNYA